jgi:thioredoxin 1
LVIVALLSGLVHGQERFDRDTTAGASLKMTLQQFHEHTKAKDKLVLVTFTASWCRICRELKPVFRQVEKEYTGLVQMISLDIDQNPEITGFFRINELPVIMFYKNGTMVWDRTGKVSRQDLADAINMYRYW